jgi:hypothetical protein
VAAVVVFAFTVLVAGLCSLPGMRQHPLVALPGVALVATAFLWQPGAQVIADGFANFWMAALAASGSLVTAALTRAERSLTLLLATGGLVVLTAHAWLPLLVLSAPAAALLVLTPLRGPASRTRRRSVLPVLVTVAVAGGVAQAVFLVRDVSVGEVVRAAGAVHGIGGTPLLTLLVLSTLLCCTDVRPVGRAQRIGFGVDPLVLVPVLAFLSLAGLLVAQLATIGTSSYYLIKFAVGVELVLATLTAMLGERLAAALPRHGARWVRLLVCLTAVVAATQALGHLAPRDAPLRPPGAPTALDRWSADIADQLLRASSAVSQTDALRSDLVAVAPADGFEADHTNLWFHALTESLTVPDPARVGLLGGRLGDDRTAAPVVVALLRSRPDGEVLVPPEWVERVRARLGGTGAAARVRTWPVDSVQAEGER